MNAYARSSMTYMGRVEFSSNFAIKGVAIYSNNSNINFITGTITFSSNTATQQGGVFYIENNSTINFARSTINWIKNTAISSGGAVFALKAEMLFANSSLTFTGNSSINGKGGAVYSSNSQITFLNTNAFFINNKAGNITNDFYLTGHAVLNVILAQNNRVEMFGGNIYKEKITV
jgi:predicted outer membrane repeat protein